MLVIRLLRSAMITLQRRRIGYLGYLATGYLVPRVVYSLYVRIPRHRVRSLRRAGIPLVLFLTLTGTWWLLGNVGSAVLWLLILVILVLLLRRVHRYARLSWMAEQARILTDAAVTASGRPRFTAWEDLPLEVPVRKAIEAAHLNEPILARLDQDGRALSVFGALPFLPAVSEDDFLERRRYTIDVVLRQGLVLIRKDYRGDRATFIREWYNLAWLQGKANVPGIWRADPKATVLYVNFIPGRTVREILVEQGARIRDSQTKDDPELASLDGKQRSIAIAARGAALIGTCLSEDFLLSLEMQINAIHRAGLANLDLKFGNVIVSAIDGSPWFVDFERPEFYASTKDLVFWLRCDEDRTTFNRLFGRQLTLETSIRNELKAFDGDPEAWYAPIDFGFGLARGRFWNTETGMGRWEYLNGPKMPSLHGFRILDLGSNNGIMPMMMLRAGAREVVTVEISTRNCQLARLVQRVFEYRDMREYCLQVHNGDMLDLSEGEWGRFDLITAFCSLYYLDVEDMIRIIRRAAQLSPMMVIQGNNQTPDGDWEKARKASVEFLARILRDNGFPEVQVVAPPGYSRPLLVGQASPRAEF